MADPLPFCIVVVCTANRCRSPLIELLARQRLERAGLLAEIDVASAGVRAGKGPMDPGAAAEAVLRGVDPSTHQARHIDEIFLEAVDLVLTADFEHRAEVVRMAPRLNSRVFTLLEFNRLTQEALREKPVLEDELSIPDRLRAVMPAIAARRGMTPPVEIGDEEIPDPVGSSESRHRMVASMIDDAVHSIVDSFVKIARGDSGPSVNLNAAG